MADTTILYDSDCEEFDSMSDAQKARYKALDRFRKRDVKQANIARKQEHAAAAIILPWTDALRRHLMTSKNAI